VKEAGAVVAVLIGGTWLLCGTGLELRIAEQFFDPGIERWALAFHQPWDFIYHFTAWPAVVLALCFLLILIRTLVDVKWRVHRRAAAFFVLLMVLGPGVIVNVVLKPNWGRPRPREVTQFAGTEPYRPVWSPNFGGVGNSFPSGHASAGFFMMAPYFMLRKRRRKLAARLWLAGGVAFGLFVGLGRMVQGGHFASDVLWSAGIVYLLSLALDAVLPPTPGQFLIPEPR